MKTVNKNFGFSFQHNLYYVCHANTMSQETNLGHCGSGFVVTVTMLCYQGLLYLQLVSRILIGC